MRILVADVGGTHVKLYLEGQSPRRFDSGPGFRPETLVDGLRRESADWHYDGVTLGIPSPVVRGRIAEEPWNLGTGWTTFDFEAALGCPTVLINDAAMQALGSDHGGRMLFLGLGSGLGTALVDEGHVVPLELARLPFRDDTFEDYCGKRGLKRLGVAEWMRTVLEAAELLRLSTAADYVVLGGGNARHFERVPDGVRLGSNDRAFAGGLKAWEHARPLPPAWQALRQASADGVPSLRALFAADPTRAERFTFTVDALHVDLSKTHLSDTLLDGLITLARASGVEDLRDAMFQGAPINTTEHRAVLHTALRHRGTTPVVVDGTDVMPAVRDVLARMRQFTDAVRSGTWLGYTGAAIRDVVHIGIGGSDLGPAMAVQALAPFTGDGPAVHFVSNIDAAHLFDTLKGLSPETTLFVVTSKTFTTQETMTNAQSARRWFLQRAHDPAYLRHHFVAVSTNTAAVTAFGIDRAQMFEFWDWVGGRYSIWSAVGLPLALALGMDRFEAMLEGAAAMDAHFQTAPPARNVPMLMGLVAAWYTSLRGVTTHAVLPYEQRLARLPAYLQQLEMESCGKRVGRDGRLLPLPSGPIIWGEPGTNGQHAFHQLLHQGTQAVTCDFLVGLEPTAGDAEHHRLLLSHCIAQSEALMVGRDAEAVAAELRAGGLDEAATQALVPHKVFPGNRPSTTIVYGRLDPRTLGLLLALYEHKVFTMAAVWGLNAFDQWGVELGKHLAGHIASDIAGTSRTPHDPSTTALIARAREARSHGTS
jgi:glucose-6-phosphate isomerase